MVIVLSTVPLEENLVRVPELVMTFDAVTQALPAPSIAMCEGVPRLSPLEKVPRLVPVDESLLTVPSPLFTTQMLPVPSMATLDGEAPTR